MEVDAHRSAPHRVTLFSLWKEPRGCCLSDMVQFESGVPGQAVVAWVAPALMDPATAWTSRLRQTRFVAQLLFSAKFICMCFLVKSPHERHMKETTASSPMLQLKLSQLLCRALQSGKKP